MNRLIYSFVLGVCVLAVLVMVAVPTSSYVSMRMVDKAERVGDLHQRSIFHVVEVSDYDTVLIRNYVTAMYNSEVADTAGNAVAVESIFYFYKKENLEGLPYERMVQMAQGDVRSINRLSKLQHDTSGYFAVRYSALYQLLGRDSLYVLPGDVIVPRQNVQLQSFIQSNSSNN